MNDFMQLKVGVARQEPRPTTITARRAMALAGRRSRGAARHRTPQLGGSLALPWAVLTILIWCEISGLGTAAAALSPDRSFTNAATPKRGGTLRLALPTDVSSLDPALAFDTVSEPFLLLLYQGLVEYDDGVNVLPCLAKDWNVSADRRVYTFHLRPGVKFSNGREVVASDFVFTLQRLLDPKTSAPAESFFEGIAGAKDFRAGKAPNVRGLRAPQSDTLVIELEEADVSFLYILTIPGAFVVPREAVEASGKSFASHPVGSGPYVLTQWRRGVKMRFERNPLFSQPDHQYLEAVQVMVGGDPSLHLMMFESGELDIADITAAPGIPVPDYIRIQRSARWRGQIERMPSAITHFLFLNTEMEPFDNPKVRQAMDYAIDKHKIVRLLRGRVIPANGFLPPMMPGYNSNRPVFPYDPGKARQLLAESGHADGFSCRLWFEAGNALTGPASASIQFDLAQVGIAAQLNPISLAPFLESMQRRRTVQCGVIGWSQDYPDPSDFLDFNFNGNRITEEGCQNLSFYNRPDVNKLLTEAARCDDPARRLGIYQAAEQIVVDDAPYVFLFHPYVYALRQPWLHGVHLHPVLYFRFERMWLDR
jgi:ABC-type transport system substrate-binding protein